MSSRDDGMTCPICYKKYPATEIENHANKCIFLNSEDNDRTSTKREGDNKQMSPTMKRQKMDCHVEQDRVRHCYNEMEGPSGSSFFRQSFTSPVPLAEQMRPSDLTHYFGQEHVLSENKVLRTLLEKRDVPSMILWGPPGCGKTTLAHIIANQCKTDAQEARFVTMSATMSGVNDVKDAVKIAKNELKSFKRRTILFMDEIHRFNKLQQDIFLPHVESGTITLIGATTENPSFSLNSALLSRCRVIVLEKLNTEHIVAILERTLKVIGAKIVKADETINFSIHDDKIQRVLIDEATVTWLAEMCDGDARVALNSLQLALQARDQGSNPGVILISLADIKDGIKAVPPEGITIFASQLHTHLTGIRVFTRHIRDGRELPELNRDNHYSTHFQEIRSLKRQVRILPGDALITTCWYKTMDRENITLGGFAISEEMCVNYMHYYPKIDLEVCKSSISSESLQTYFRFLHDWEGQHTKSDLTISENYKAVHWTPMRTHILQQLYHEAPLSMQCNQSTGERFPGYWENMPITPILFPFLAHPRDCATHP